MHFKSDFTSDSLSFEWVSEIEFACPYIDNIVRNPRLALINEEDVVKIEKARKVSVESVKDLSKHTQYIDRVDEETDDVDPSKILIVRREETYNTYENRVIYTLINNLSRFLMKKEQLLEDLKTKNDKVLEYAASTNNGIEKVDIELKICANKILKDKNDNDLEKELNLIRKRVKRIRDYITGWERNEFTKALIKARASFVFPPVRKTNMILKNPNFQFAMKLWDYLQNYEEEKDNSVDNLDTTGNDVLKGILDESFLIDYFVLDSVVPSKKEQKAKLSKYAVIMIEQQIQRIITLLLNSGIKISDEEVLAIVANGIKNEKDKRLAVSADVKNKFKNAMEEYLERTKDCL